MSEVNLVVRLESPLKEYSGSAPVREIIVLALNWPTPYWPDLAIAWIEQGAEMDTEIIKLLESVAATKNFPQKLRHRAFALAHRKSEGENHA